MPLEFLLGSQINLTDASGAECIQQLFTHIQQKHMDFKVNFTAVLNIHPGKFQALQVNWLQERAQAGVRARGLPHWKGTKDLQVGAVLQNCEQLLQ